MLLTSASRGRTQILAAVFFLILLIVIFRSNFVDTSSWTHPSASPPVGSPSDSKTEDPKVEAEEPATTEQAETVPDPCAGFPDTSDILLVMKTGATEAYDKLPIHFLTTMKCIKDVVIFSDSEMHMGDYHLIDTLDEIAEDVKKDNGDFDLYRTLKQFEKLHQDPRTLKNGGSGWGNGWNLDKYKFLPMMVKTWRYRQDAKWYVFVEADTALNWYNLRTFLDTLNSEKHYYIGSPTYLDIEFAHGGTGYIISGSAMKTAVGGHPDIQKKYDGSVKPICCGDRMISRVLLDEDIKLTRAWPMLNGEKPLTLPFGENQWCQPFITMHHMTAQEVSQVWTFQQKRLAAGNKVRTLSFSYHALLTIFRIRFCGWMSTMNSFTTTYSLPERTGVTSVATWSTRTRRTRNFTARNGMS